MARRHDKGFWVFFVIALILAIAGIAAETYAWIIVDRVGLDHAPTWALWLIFHSR